MTTIDYKKAGVDIEVANTIVQRIKPLAKQTFSPQVCTEIGSFGALYDLKKWLEEYKHPLLVQSIDGVGTKTQIACQMQKYDTLGIDLVSATANDIVVMGAKPLTLLDYIAAEKLHPDTVEQIVFGIAQACCEEGISLIGGETAEMPGIYRSQEYDLAAVITGVVDKEKVIMGKNIVPGDLVLGINSSGLHTNGYSLARKLFFEVAGFAIDSYQSALGGILGEVLLEPHLNYTKPILHCLNHPIKLKGMAHITGGGFLENIPRILPANCAVSIQKNSWVIPPIFSMMEKLGNLNEQQLFSTFNMGIGLIIIIAEEELENLEQQFVQFPKFDLYRLGQVIEYTNKKVRLV